MADHVHQVIDSAADHAGRTELKLDTEVEFKVSEPTVMVPGLLPGKFPGSIVTSPRMEPEPLKVAPLSTWTFELDKVPLIDKRPAATVVVLV